MPARMAYTINGPPLETSSPISTQRSPSIRRDPNVGSVNLRAMYQDSAVFGNREEIEESKAESSIIDTTPKLPPTPPRAGNETDTSLAEEISSDVPQFRSALVTPINHHSPPTPDNTPPRERILASRPRFLGTQPSFASTHAESFRTAREENMSDDESEWQQISRDEFSSTNDHHPSRSLHGAHLFDPALPPRSKLSETLDVNPPVHNFVASSTASTLQNEIVNTPKIGSPLNSDQIETTVNHVYIYSPPNQAGQINGSLQGDLTGTEKVDPEPPVMEQVEQNETDAAAKSDHIRRGRSLRDRLAESQQHSASASTEKFATIIGWSNSVSGEAEVEAEAEAEADARRFSGISTTSTIEAFVFDSSPLPRRRTTLRHVPKNDSLRSASSPFPVSKRDSMNSSSDSPHRLVHKKARLSNQNRWSFGSEVSRSFSLSSSAVLPKTEIIRVAVIPERTSSLQSSAKSSRRASLSTASNQSQIRKSSENPPSSWQHKKTTSGTSERGRGPQAGLVVPPRSSSLSAPTSRATSRAGSVTSEHIRVRRQEAEKDLRKTLDRMESERLVATLSDLYHDDSRIKVSDQGNDPLAGASERPIYLSVVPNVMPSTQSGEDLLRTPRHKVAHNEDAYKGIVPGSAEWAALRPTSLGETPFSQPSFQSASPEINEARAINFFPHNNHSLQLIEPNQTQESRAVQEVRKQQISEVDSPLRNPRQPPRPPRFKVFPPPARENLNHDLKNVGHRQSIRKTGSLRRPDNQRNPGSFVKSLGRNFSLNNARNTKADQELDGTLHPFWRPQAFWNVVENEEPQNQDRGLEDPGLVNNSLGIRQERVVVTGPFSLVRRISERRRQNRMIIKQTSYGSLSRLHGTRKLYKVPALGIHLRYLGIRGLQDHLLYARQRKEDEKRERRREALRQSIGANVISQGDSRFPASDTSLVKIGMA